MAAPEETIASRVDKYILSPRELIDPEKCKVGTDIRPLKADGAAELAETIKENGWIHTSSIVVRESTTDPGWYDVVDGWHRCEAARILKTKGLWPLPGGEEGIPASVFKAAMPDDLMVAYAHGNNES